ncbi:hypothetical protein K443DRAFT_664554, partial [Laccaria amethystina LaAM-08-1]
KRQASNADKQPVKRSRRRAQKDNEDEDDNEEAAAAHEWADLEDQVTKTKGKGGRGGNRGRAASNAERVLADSDVSVAPPRRSLRRLNPTPGQPTPTDNHTTAPTAATRRRQAPQPQADETDAGRLANETNKEATHDTKANEQNDDPEKEGDTKQAETDEDEESNNDDQHAEQDNQQDNAEANDQRDRNPDPNLDMGLATRQRATTTATRPQAALT